MPKHYPYSPSATGRWLACPGSVDPDNLPPQGKSSEYAEEGTRAHAVCEALLKGEHYEPDSPEMEAYCWEFVKVCEELQRQPDFHAEHIERTVQHPSLEHLGGTVDYMAVTSDPMMLHLVDFKYGQGVPVSAINNLQLLTYAVILNAHYQHMFEGFSFHIVQPRVQNGDTYSNWNPTLEQVTAHETAIIEAMHQNHYAAGDHCRWCPLKPTCDTFRATLDEIADQNFSDVTVYTPELVTRWLKYLDMKSAIEDALGQMKDELLHANQLGIDLPGHEVRNRNGRRTWSADAEQKLIKKFGKRKVTQSVLLSPAQLEKQLPEAEELISKLIEQKVTQQIVKVEECLF